MNFPANRIFVNLIESCQSQQGSPVIRVFQIRQVSCKPGKQEIWSYDGLPKINVGTADFKRIKQMQFTEFNEELVVLVETTHVKLDRILFLRQAVGEPRRWENLQPVDVLHSSPFNERIYMTVWEEKMISEYSYTDGHFLRSLSLGNNPGRKLLICHSYKFVDFSDQVIIVTHMNTRQGGVVTVPMNNFDENHVSKSRSLPNSVSACLDSVADKIGNLFILVDEGVAYGVVFAPANQEELVRCLIRIPKLGLKKISDRPNQLLFDESRELIFLFLQTSYSILTFRVPPWIPSREIL